MFCTTGTKTTVLSTFSKTSHNSNIYKPAHVNMRWILLLLSAPSLSVALAAEGSDPWWAGTFKMQIIKDENAKAVCSDKAVSALNTVVSHWAQDEFVHLLGMDAFILNNAVGTESHGIVSLVADFHCLECTAIREKTNAYNLVASVTHHLEEWGKDNDKDLLKGCIGEESGVINFSISIVHGAETISLI